MIPHRTQINSGDCANQSSHAMLFNSSFWQWQKMLSEQASPPISLDTSPLQYERKCPERYASAILLVPNYNLNDCQSTKSVYICLACSVTLLPVFVHLPLIHKGKPRCLLLSKKIGGGGGEVRHYISSEFPTKHWLKRLEVWVNTHVLFCEGLGQAWAFSSNGILFVLHLSGLHAYNVLL